MNQAPLNNSNIQIGSKHYINGLEGSLIQITRALAIEHNIRPDPEAKSMARVIAQDKVNLLLSDIEKKGIRELTKQTEAILKGIGPKKEDYARLVYEALKTAGYDNV